METTKKIGPLFASIFRLSLQRYNDTDIAVLAAVQYLIGFAILL
jgi:hypothetical protein